MARNPRQFFPDLPPAPEPYPGSERFGDWDFGTITALEPGVPMVHSNPEGDPHQLAYQGEENPHLKPKKPRKRFTHVGKPKPKAKPEQDKGGA